MNLGEDSANRNRPISRSFFPVPLLNRRRSCWLADRIVVTATLIDRLCLWFGACGKKLCVEETTRVFSGFCLFVFSFVVGLGASWGLFFCIRVFVVLLYLAGSMPPRGSTFRLARFLCGDGCVGFLFGVEGSVLRGCFWRVYFFLSDKWAIARHCFFFFFQRTILDVSDDGFASLVLLFFSGIRQLWGLSNDSGWNQLGCLLRTISCQNPTI